MLPTKLPTMRMARAGSLAVVAFLFLAAMPTSANTILPTTPVGFTTAVTQWPTIAVSTVAHAQPPAGTPVATSDALPGPLAGFPTQGPTFGILSSGNALAADDPNNSGWYSANNGGGAHHGALDRDVTSMRLDLQGTPRSYHCVSFDFRFLTEEYAEWVGSRYNDAFLAIVNGDGWYTTTSSSIVAPGNFAYDEYGNLISVNSAGAVSVRSWKAAGTTYDGATSRLHAQKVAYDADGVVQLYLTIFDVGDSIYDSTVFVDRVQVTPYVWWGCKSGLRGFDFDVDVNLRGETYALGQSVYFEATATADEGGAIVDAQAEVLVSLVLQEETDELPLETCPAWAATLPTNGEGVVAAKIPPVAELACPDMQPGVAGKYLVAAKIQTGADEEEGTLYGEGLGGFVADGE